MTKRFKRFVFALAALLATPALATPVLKPAITVNHPIVTVGDMFSDAGLLAEEPLFRAPQPGTAGKVSVADIRTAAARIGIESFDHAGMNAVRVARAGSRVTQDMLNLLIANKLRSRGEMPSAMSVDLDLDRELGALHASSAEQPLTLDDLNYLSGSKRFSARFTVAGRPEPLTVEGALRFSVEVPHFTRAMASGTVIRPDDLVMRPVAVQYADSVGALTMEQTVGKQVKRQMREGLMVRPNDIAEPLLVSRNDEVTLILNSGRLTLTVKGQALSDASRGETVSVLNLVSSRVVKGIATDAGTVEIRSGEGQTL